ncbi:MAG TPA: cytochrome c oxidase subunit II [Verrucomicrobiae bacterium]|nr:cytochrome c oxidase subunit II [Verrucomicrobiae bacterium]
MLASEHGKHVDDFILYVHYLMGVLFVGWFAYFLYALFRFRASKHPKARYAGAQSHASSYIEIAVAAIEGVLLVGLAVPLWAKFADQFPADSEATVVRVVAQQFLWNGVYPGKDGKFGKQDFRLVNSTNQFGWDYTDPATHDNFTGDQNVIVVPEGKPVITHISSKDVIHSFKINPFRVTQDAIPGMTIPIWFRPTTNGVFLINCAQLCGNSHYYMKGTFNVVSQEKYDEFVAAKSASAGTAAQSFE